jgi:hypothetical protein
VRIIIINRLDNMAVTSWFYIMDYFYIKVVRIDLQKQSKTPNIVWPNSHGDVEFWKSWALSLEIMVNMVRII